MTIDSRITPANSEKTRISERGVIVCSQGDVRYARMAINLARSIRVHNRSLPLAIVTDQDPALFAGEFDVVIERDFGAWSGVLGKVLLYDASPFTRTLYLDSDVLVFGSLAPAFEHFAGNAFAVLDERIRPNRWFIGMRSVRDRIPGAGRLAFSGAMYYWERSAVAERIFRRAIEWRPYYDEVGARRYRGRENEEVLFALAMFEAGIGAVAAETLALSLSMLWPIGRRVEQDVIAGNCRVFDKANVQRRIWMHYYGGATNCYAYIREAHRLQAEIDRPGSSDEIQVRCAALRRWLDAPPRGVGKLAFLLQEWLAKRQLL